MNKKDRNSLLMLAGGATVMGVSMLTSNSISGFEVTQDALEAVESVLKILEGSGVVLGVVGLLRLASKYGKLFYDYVKEKFSHKSHSNENELNHTRQSVKNSSKDSLNSIQKNLQVGYNRGADINQSFRRSAHNPTSRVRTVSKQAVKTAKSEQHT